MKTLYPDVRGRTVVLPEVSAGSKEVQAQTPCPPGGRGWRGGDCRGPRGAGVTTVF